MSQKTILLAAAGALALTGGAAFATTSSKAVNTVNYECSNGEWVDIEYHFGSPRSYAILHGEQKPRRLYLKDSEDDEEAVFSDGTYTWNISGLYEANAATQGGGMLTRKMVQRVNRKRVLVDNIVGKECNPGKPRYEGGNT